ncbi:hypothetical protein WV31_11065 [Magnetospirillum sp. ME-1]|uniref:hypothetical protein n=1 Tax=Magnetospirillum sp. ME-1 TaxID=1639348 RepID=UPI000A179ADD|nr:hypothetical protein [Magnetospirillum sp. ME-1]ARJ66163.1 hypothetical protein WV31_11065 [Magnetospirillum sp. ME-1]
MSRSITIAALAALLLAAPAWAQSSKGTSCDQLPEIKQAFKRFDGKPADRDRAKWQIETAEKLCKEGKADEAKGYIDVAHGLVLKDHKH